MAERSVHESNWGGFVDGIEVTISEIIHSLELANTDNDRSDIVAAFNAFRIDTSKVVSDSGQLLKQLRLQDVLEKKIDLAKSDLSAAVDSLDKSKSRIRKLDCEVIDLEARITKLTLEKTRVELKEKKQADKRASRVSDLPECDELFYPDLVVNKRKTSSNPRPRTSEAVDKIEGAIMQRQLPLLKVQAKRNKLLSSQLTSESKVQKLQLAVVKLESDYNVCSTQIQFLTGNVVIQFLEWEKLSLAIGCDPVLPDILKDVLLEKNLHLLQTDKNFHSAIELIQGSIPEGLSSVIETLYNAFAPCKFSTEAEWNRVFSLLKHVAILNEEEHARKYLDRIQERHLTVEKCEERVAVAKSNFDRLISSPIDNPLRDLPWYRHIKLRLTDSESRLGYRRYKSWKRDVEEAQEKCNSTKESQEKELKKLQESKALLLGNGYPTEASDYRMYVEYLILQREMLYSSYPYFTSFLWTRAGFRDESKKD